jgi:hypothetical protein
MVTTADLPRSLTSRSDARRYAVLKDRRNVDYAD